MQGGVVLRGCLRELITQSTESNGRMVSQLCVIRGGYKERASWSLCPCFYLTFQVSLLAVSPEKRHKVGMVLCVATVCTLVQPYTGHLGSVAFSPAT